MQQTLLEVLSQIRSAWRFRWYGVAVAWAIAATGWIWVSLQPDVYEANARVYVDMSSVLTPLLNNRIVASDVSTRLLYVRQALLGREYLERVASENGLDTMAATPAEREDILRELRSTISISGAPADREEVARRDSSSIFNISYRHPDPKTAEGVVSTLLNFLIEDTLGANRQGTDTAERFLDDRIREYENRLQQAEQALAKFQRDNSGRLPGSEGGYFERMQRERETLEETRRQLRLAESRRAQLAAQLNGSTPLTEDATNSTREPAPNSLDARIRDNRAQLDRLLLEYTDKHPDVVATREALARLEAQRAEQLRELGLTDPDQQLSSLGANPVYQAVQIALNQVDVELSTLRADASDRERRLKDLQGLIDEVPGVEAELARLNRDYNVIKDQYQALIQSRETQALSRKASDTDQVEFRVLNPPRADFTPVAPPRLMWLAAVLCAGLGAGGGLCYLLAQLKPVFSNGRALSEAVGIPLLGTVTRVVVSAEARKQQRFELLSFSVALTSLVVAFGAVVAFEVLGPGLRGVLGS